jgi:hypothetical protein
MDDAIAELRRRWEVAEGRRDALEAEAEARVRRWVWTTSNSVRWRFEPYYGERNGLSPGRILTSAPERLEEVDAYGYDEEGRLALARLYRRPAGRYDVVAFEHEGPRTWTTFVNERGGRVRVGLVEHGDDGRLSAVIEYQEDLSGEATWWEERYVWDGGRLTEIHKRSDEQGAVEPERAARLAGERELLEYDKHGALTAIRSAWGHVYRRPETDIRTVLRRFEQALPAAVDLALARAGDLRPFALALLYDAEKPIPPTLWVGSRDDIEAGLNPAEWDGPELSLPLEPLGIEVGVLAGAIGREEAEEDARSALNRAVKKLNRSPPEAWGDDPPIVFAVDLELEHLAQNLREAVPAARRRELGLT